MRYYNEPGDLGGAGYCPDYENKTFRQSMKNFIEDFGKKYDGDGRLGFITLGLLGFWGEGIIGRLMAQIPLRLTGVYQLLSTRKF